MREAIVEHCGYRRAWIGYADRDEAKTIRKVTHSGVEESIFKPSDLSRAEHVMHPTALAIRSGAPRVGHLVQEEPAPAYLHEAQGKHGYVSVSAFPLIIDREVVGNLSIVASEADAFGDEAVNVLSELADDVSFGIAALRARKRQEEAEEALRHMALHDGVTGVPNRSLFRTRIEKLIAEASRTFRPLAVCLLAVDQLREVTDMLGRGPGDLAAVRDLKCDVAQGYFISQPLPVEEDAAWRVAEGVPQATVHWPAAAGGLPQERIRRPPGRARSPAHRRCTARRQPSHRQCAATHAPPW